MDHTRHNVTATFLVALFVMVLFVGQAFANPNQWRAEGWKTDFNNTSIDYSEVLSGGPPKDGIPSIDNPTFVSVSEEKNLGKREPVIGLEINGDARAYPLRILMWHEIVNDVVGGEPVTVTYCPLCNAAIVFDAKVDGKAHAFGTTGKLRNSDLVMYDRTTESWWQQFTGTAVAGEYTGKKLKLVASRLESWSEFKARFPSGKVLVPNSNSLRRYGQNPYVNYDSASTPFLYRGSMPKDISPMQRVVIVRDDAGSIHSITSMVLVRKAKTYKIGDVTLEWHEGQASALDSSEISAGREVGSIIVTKGTGSAAKEMPYDVTFAFVAHAFHPEIEIRKN